ncbi:transposase [Kitasatospora sp. MAP5-34]|uniref:transposase n=1 Tax=Kitasatospora sp. MAP5-34 TaxID=3035102 RepID=UPI00247443E5|nr:transposase [Kitasatospora sp. MAP5-34]MDH6576900.1 transposase [Kitasatospora sp. MAP5-34]
MGVIAEKRRKFDAEFRAEAVRTVIRSGKPAAEVARELGINETTLATWVSRARKAGGDGTLNTPEREELLRLRRRNAEQSRRIEELELERDALKRCMVLWAN